MPTSRARCTSAAICRRRNSAGCTGPVPSATSPRSSTGRTGSTSGIELNSRASGPPLDDLRRIPNRLCVAVGGGKAAALAAALEGGYITHLLADQRLLAGVARIMDSTSS